MFVTVEIFYNMKIVKVAELTKTYGRNKFKY